MGRLAIVIINLIALLHNERLRSCRFAFLFSSPLSVLFCLQLTFLLGCGRHLSVTPITVSSVKILGPSQIRAGQSAGFTASAIAKQPTFAVKWFVDETEGGNATLGTISLEGIYTAPGEPQNVSISWVAAQDKSIRASMDVQILNPIPAISSVSLAPASGLTGTISITGTGFVEESTVSLNGKQTPATRLSDKRITTSEVELPADTRISITISNPAPGPSDSNSFELITSPTSLDNLTGCENPNTGQPIGGFGANTLVYVDDNRMRNLIGTPHYTENAIYWISREAEPGQSILLSGAFTPAAKYARLAKIIPGSIDWQSAVNASESLVQTEQQGTTGLSFKIPKDLGPGVYGYKIEDPLAPPIYGLANAPSVSWIVGVPTSTNPQDALQTGIHDCAAEPGEQIRVFGRNFVSSNQFVLQSTSGDIYPLNTTLKDPSSLIAQIPTTIVPGTYFAWVGSRAWDASSSAAITIQILPSSKLRVEHVKCTSLIPDGATDNTSQLQRCLEEGAPPPSSNVLAYIDLPPGKFAIKGELTISPNEILSGSSSESTEIIGTPSDHQPHTWISAPRFAGIANLSLVSPGDSEIVASLDCSGNPGTSGHFYIANASFASSLGQSTDWLDEVKLCGPDIQIYDSSFSGMTSLLSITLGDGAIIAGNVFDTGVGVAGFQASQNVIVESNRFTSDSAVGTVHGNSAIWISRPFCKFGPSYTSQNFYISSNTFSNIGSISNQTVITTDGGGGAYYGPVASSTSDSVTLADDPGWAWTGITRPGAAYVVVLYGTGAGQYSQVRSWSDRTISLQNPWTVRPDSSSIVEIISLHRNLILANNEFNNDINSQAEIGNTVDLVVEDNRITNSQYAFLLRAYGPYGGPAAYGPVINADILRNSVLPGQDTLMYHQKPRDVYRSGIGLFNGFGTILSGIMVRANTISNQQSIFSTNGCGGVNAVVIEQNSAEWVSAGCDVPGFLVQDNVDPH